MVSKLNIKVFLKQAKPFAEFTLLFVASVQLWYTYHKYYIICIDLHFLWVQSIISIIYNPWLYWKFVLDSNFLRVSDFCEGLAPIPLIMSLSKDKVPSIEKSYADSISYGNGNKLSPIESIKTKHRLFLGTSYFGNTQPMQHLFHFRFAHFRAQRNWSIFKRNLYQLECFDQIGFSSIWKWCVLIYQPLGFINCIQIHY